MEENKPSIGNDIIEHYKPYNNTKTVWNKTILKEQEFEVDKYYKINRIRKQTL